METEETVKEECVAMSKTKRIWLAFVDIVLFTVLFMIFLFLFAIPFAIAFPELKTQAGGMSVYLMMLNEVLMLASGLIDACMVLGFRKIPFSGLGLSLKGWGRSLLNGALFVVFLYVRTAMRRYVGCLRKKKQKKRRYGSGLNCASRRCGQEDGMWCGL